MGVIKYGVLAVALSACGTEKISQCTKDSDCKDIAYPFCDVDGQYSPSGGEHNVCTVTPSDCPVDRCGCSPGATSCDGDTLTTCNTDGMSQSMATCSLGCSASKDKCASFTPTNGLGPALASGMSVPAATFPDGASLDTNTGELRDSSGTPVATMSVEVSQSGGPKIRAFYAGSFDIGSLTVTGDEALAFVAPGQISIHGTVSVKATGSTNAPGAAPSNLPCVGQSGAVGGGGGNSTAGGNAATNDGSGNITTILGGVALSTYSPLIGGCKGGDGGGGGGGGVQLVSASAVVFTSAIVNLGGGGAPPYAGGGAGGTLLIEAPTVKIQGTIAANGGGGGGCSGAGQDAGITDTPASAGTNSGAQCGGAGGGHGATRTTMPGNGAAGNLNSGSGGGGALGRMMVRTKDGTFDSAGMVPEIVVATSTLELE